jgi:hypothetical protein
MTDKPDGKRGFVVRASGGIIEVPAWLSTNWPDGRRDFTCIAELAEVFKTIEEAHAAIANVPAPLNEAGVMFSVEPAET